MANIHQIWSHCQWSSSNKSLYKIFISFCNSKGKLRGPGGSNRIFLHHFSAKHFTTRGHPNFFLSLSQLAIPTYILVQSPFIGITLSSPLSLFHINVRNKNQPYIVTRQDDQPHFCLPYTHIHSIWHNFFLLPSTIHSKLSDSLTLLGPTNHSLSLIYATIIPSSARTYIVTHHEARG